MAQPNNGVTNNQPSGIPLAPLEFLQNQRRGSITEPSLHAAALHATPRQNINSQFFRQDKSNLQPRPASPYTFGSATHTADNTHLRKLLRTPSPDRENSQGSTSRIPSGNPKNDGGDAMNVDSERQQPHSTRHMSHEPQGQFDYSMRRHSIAVGQNPHSRSASHLSAAPQGIKRKMSADPAGFPTVGEEIDPTLAGPGVPSGMDMDADAPAPKRRGSTIDTQRIAQLSLNDRRDSLDSRGPQWWVNDRRDSSSSMFSSVSSVGGYSSSFSGGDSPHGRPPPGIATFAWPSHPPDQPGLHNEVDPNMPVPPRTFEPSAPVGVISHMNFSPERRMSVPDPLNPAPTGQRVLRSRSRPPSRQKHSPDANHSGPSSGQDDPSPPSPTGSGKHSKESSSTTPYSRSPELRVSHKLAERKRRKEMKELFDELRDQLPADRGMKASKWEILSKAIDFVTQLKQGHQDMAREVEMLRHELETIRPGAYPPGSFAHPPGQSGLPTGVVQQPAPSISRPGSSQNSYPPSAGGPTGQNHRTDGPPA
ncbi:hypothetical protein C8F04DRAFT_1058586 [Mycena alexandri]|uniref:BHLH domain-containing protein n=1 Tax=Mycena alexandri TaxID=1745969 RepID=A0AAD6TL83_9AGAR|nr:hypothetical protein C8F04DRAFT_1058586 [Mycena alexandri]